MTTEAEYKAIEATLDIYRSRLDTIPDEQFDVTPPAGGWSYAEVYSHILQANLGSSIAAEKCTLSTCKPGSKGRSVVGFFVLTFNRFPPFRVKAPKTLAAANPVKKISKEDARNLIVKCRRRIGEVAALIAKSNHNGRIKHPRLGMLNADQWFRFILIHSRHHLKQLNRIEKSFRGNN
ncbi:MAG: DinB family protein [Bacteroidetes bacterium]|nr:DinB family protein [Bacteroidota bacterium]